MTKNPSFGEAGTDYPARVIAIDANGGPLGSYGPFTTAESVQRKREELRSEGFNSRVEPFGEDLPGREEAVEDLQRTSQLSSPSAQATRIGIDWSDGLHQEFVWREIGHGATVGDGVWDLAMTSPKVPVMPPVTGYKHGDMLRILRTALERTQPGEAGDPLPDPLLAIASKAWPLMRDPHSSRTEMARIGARLRRAVEHALDLAEGDDSAESEPATAVAGSVPPPEAAVCPVHGLRGQDGFLNAFCNETIGKHEGIPLLCGRTVTAPEGSWGEAVKVVEPGERTGEMVCEECVRMMLGRQTVYPLAQCEECGAWICTAHTHLHRSRHESLAMTEDDRAAQVEVAVEKKVGAIRDIEEITRRMRVRADDPVGRGARPEEIEEWISALDSAAARLNEHRIFGSGPFFLGPAPEPPDEEPPDEEPPDEEFGDPWLAYRGLLEVVSRMRATAGTSDTLVRRLEQIAIGFRVALRDYDAKPEWFGVTPSDNPIFIAATNAANERKNLKITRREGSSSGQNWKVEDDHGNYALGATIYEACKRWLIVEDDLKAEPQEPSDEERREVIRELRSEDVLAPKPDDLSRRPIEEPQEKWWVLHFKDKTGSGERHIRVSIRAYPTLSRAIEHARAVNNLPNVRWEFRDWQRLPAGPGPVPMRPDPGERAEPVTIFGAARRIWKALSR